jgi:hypothetical protein
MEIWGIFRAAIHKDLHASDATESTFLLFGRASSSTARGCDSIYVGRWGKAVAVNFRIT